jgi:hypothetical protein
MNRTYARIAGLAAIASLVLTTSCYGEVDAEPAYYPPPSYVATSDPVFYDGHAVYWYGGHWAYRDGGGRWNYYRHEPAFLARHRAMAAPPHRTTYEHPARRRF